MAESGVIQNQNQNQKYQKKDNKKGLKLNIEREVNKLFRLFQKGI